MHKVSDPRPEPALILIVDDVASNILVIREAVRDLGDVRFTTSGLGALDMVKTMVPDIILLDIEMPGMDGYAVAAALKADPRLHDVAIIFVTSHDRDVHELQALTQGGVDFLHKPLNVPVARARIQTHLALRLKSKQLALAQRDLIDVVQHLPAFVAYWDNDLRNGMANDVDGHWFGTPAEAMRGMTLRSVLGEANFLAIEPQIAAVLRGENPSFGLTFVRPDGSPLYGQVSLVSRQQPGIATGFLMLITDVSERKKAELALYDEKERLRITLNSIGDAVIATDGDGIVTFLNPIAEDMTGWGAREAIGQAIEKVMPLRDNGNGHILINPIRLALTENRTVGMALNCALLRRDGRLLDVEDSAAPIKDYEGNLTGAIIVFHDVSEARAMAVKMTHLASHDALTNLPNRMVLQDRAEQAVQQSKRTGDRVALFMLDLDHFKGINDSVGHTVGDQLLQRVAKRLKDTLRPCDTISRPGGDEFIVLMPDISGIEQVSSLASRLLKVVSHPSWVGEGRYDLTVSIGISIYPDDAESLEDIYRHADAAMYRAKHDGRNRYRFFSAEIEEALRSRHTLERSLRTAVERGGFEVFYQPKIDVRDKSIVGAEALVRWRTSEGLLISPAQFIPLAEETGLIVPLGEFVLRQACLDARKWQQGGKDLRIAVNVSALQIAEKNFVATVSDILTKTGLPPGLLELEITEGVLARDIDTTLETIIDLKALGVTIAIDDFGTGYSSLAYLEQYPIDVLKIDQSFVRNMKTEKSPLAIITAIIHMAHALDMRLVAEGVETEEQSASLLDLGCPIMQGYLYGRPMPFDKMNLFLQETAPERRMLPQE